MGASKLALSLAVSFALSTKGSDVHQKLILTAAVATMVALLINSHVGLVVPSTTAAA